ncbi:succinic semialdehyde dehydrogenase [Halorientalis brevis]|uniref:Succinic semialdehyde dehydrogenase n=1 Tax=Halorientalis brevis TaxID=1126241 RepID=A0ABD6CC01_9EURY|nr:succinic semialdehyde dehydrogenase [Halorientalis brevis]
MANAMESRREAAEFDTEFERLRERVTLADDSRESIPVVAPFTGEQVGTIPAGTEADVDEAVERARAAGEQWAERSPEERAAVVDEFHDLVLDRQDELLDVIQTETGKARLDAFEEVLDVASTARYYVERGPGLLTPTRREGAIPLATRTEVRHHPVGVVGIISPWNYPLALSISDAIPALIAGNGVVFKTAAETSVTALKALELLEEAGLPADLCQVVTGRGSELGEPLIDRVDYLTFTGSTETGRTVAAQAGRNLIDCSLELGGKNPMLILDDADVDVAVQGAIDGSFTNAGQLCLSAERIYVHETVADAFTERFVAETETLHLGVGYDWKTDVGSLTSEAHLEKVEAHVEDAVDAGATVLAGGEARPDVGPYVFEPTILTDVPESAELYREETFGPVVSIYEVGSVEEAIEKANDTEYGLNASVFTQDSILGREVAQQIEAGTVGINDAYGASYGSVDAPMGGRKQSGVGRRHGSEGLLKYTEAQTIAEQRTGPVAPPEPLPHEWYARLMTGLMRVLKRIS